ncbi:uncharacterized protein EV422DRAFT_512075 [Fimicolochytrium jonesii]|uniref:uncharacterized protein n=1 Tax=Fimicolochytrium jonesii TaxID=1396493 RepID=UPI0022FE11BD|nr:uncharacterized protein EV422DRAFT_512075 [Fimicolochytrium jonesii]KAI8826954.1 hypothetical protein EV422DRAFT_512075 [Fimicolochytrium jonesii]
MVSALNLFLATTAVALTAIGVPTARGSEPDVGRRDEENQQRITPDGFPHVLGYERIDTWRDSSVDPCQDFYRHACGGFQQRYQSIPNATVFSMMGKSSALLMERALSGKKKGITKPAPDSALFEKARTYYSSCVDSNTIKERGFAPIIPYAQDLLDYAVNSRSLPQLFSRLHQTGVYALFVTSYAKVTGHAAKDLALQFNPAPAHQVAPHTVKKVLAAFIDNSVLQLPPDANLNDIVEWIVAIETEAKKFIEALDAGQVEGDGLKKAQFLSVEDLSRRTNQDWSIYINAMNMTGVNQIYFYGETDIWIDTINSLLDYNPRDFQYYLLWKLGAAHFNKLAPEYFNIWAKEIRGMISYADYVDERHLLRAGHQTECVRETGVQLNYLSAHMFAKYALNDTQKAAAKVMVDRLLNSFGTKLGELSWMDDKTKQHAREKLQNTVSVVGYPDWLMDANLVEQYYAPLRIERGRYFENAVQAQTFAYFAPSIKQVGKAVDRSQLFQGYAWEFNAFALLDSVQIQINPAFLQRPLYSARNPQSLNYGSLGMVIGHEITHGYGAVGWLYNKDGEHQDWWTKKSLAALTDGATCFREQYGNYTVTLSDGSSRPVDGAQTVGENIADNGGLAVAYKAWRTAESKALGVSEDELSKKEEPGFGGLTKDQLFFLGFGQTWCTNQDDAALKSALANDVHAPGQARVVGPLQNSEEFARAYNCPLGSPMNPRRAEGRCSLY